LATFKNGNEENFLEDVNLDEIAKKTLEINEKVWVCIDMSLL